MRATILLALLSLIGAGCSANSHQSAVAGTWVFDPARYAPPEEANELRRTRSGWITVLSDGTYRSWSRFDDRTSDESGKWRMIGGVLTLHPIDRNWPDRPQTSFPLRGNVLFEPLIGDAGVIYEREAK